MKLRYLFSLSIIAAATFLAACGSTPETPVNSANTANAAKPANANVTNSNPEANLVAVSTPTPDPNQANNAPTLTPIYKAYCAAVVKKDDAAVAKFFDAATLKEFEQQMKEDGIKSISAFVDPVSTDLCEVANERFKGDKGVAKVKTKSYPNGFDVLWLKEGGEWKMSSISPEKGF